MSGGLTTGGVDSGIALQAGKGQGEANNPLQQIGQFANIQNALNQNKLFPGQAALQQQQVQSGQVGLAQKINQAGYQALTPLLSGTINHDNLTTALGSVESNLGLPTQGILADIMKTAPSGDGPEFDAKVRGLIAARSQTAPESAVGMVTPGVGPQIDNGPVIALTTKGAPGSQTPGQLANAGAITKGFAPQIYNDGREGLPLINGQSNGTILTNHPAPGRVDTGLKAGVGVEGNDGADVGLSRAQLATPTPLGVDAQGRPYSGTLNQYISKSGDTMPLGTGRLPPELLNPNRAQGIQTGLGPAQQAAATQTGAGSAKAFQDIQEQGVQAKSQGAVLGNMLGDLAGFAPGATHLNDYAKTLQRYAPSIAKAFGVTPEQVAANESFDKLANQIANQQGASSDAHLAVAQNANPGSHLSPAGADMIIRQLQGNADYLQARQKLAQQYSDQGDRTGFEAGPAAQIDPRAFQFDRMTPDQQKTYVKSLSTTDQDIVHKAYLNARRQGLLASAASQ